MLKIVTFVLLCSTLLSVLSAPVTNTWQLSGTLNKGAPVAHSIAFGETFYFQGKVDITLNSHTEEKLVLCIQEGTPLPNYERYGVPNACKYKLNFDAAPVVTTTGHSTTGTHTTTGHSTTGTHTTTGHSTTGHSTTGHSTTGTHTTTGHATTSGSTTGHATTGSTTGTSLKKSLKKSGHGFSVNFARYASTQSVDLRAGPHFFGVYYDGSTTFKTQTVSFNITATYCDNGYGPDCKPVQKLSDILDKNVTVSENVYYSYEVKASEPGTTLQDIHITFNKNDTLGVVSRFRGIPTATLNDGTGSNELKLVDPAIGTWVFEFTFNNTGGNHIYYITSLKSTLCNNGTGGENCAATLTNSTTLTSKSDLNVKLAKTNDIKYYAIYNSTFSGLYVSISDTAAKDKAVIYASFNRVPQPKNGTFDADISGCNGAYCTAVQSISSKTANLTADTVTGVWYVAVVAARENTEFNFWYDTICPRDCGGQGTCGSNADNYGVCACNANFAGPICSPSNPLIEYIILIVIAALVLVSAILGLIAWAYMRRRAQYVEVK